MLLCCFTTSYALLLLFSQPATATSPQATAAPPQSEASDTAPAPRSFLRPPPTLAQMVEHGASNAKIMGSIPRESKS